MASSKKLIFQCLAEFLGTMTLTFSVLSAITTMRGDGDYWVGQVKKPDPFKDNGL